MTIDLPTPPSANNAYACVRNRKILRAEGRAYKADVAMRLTVAKWRPLDGAVTLTIYWRRAIRAGDLSNRIKIVEDALKGRAWHDDNQVVELHAYRTDDKENPGVTVTVEAA